MYDIFTYIGACGYIYVYTNINNIYIYIYIHPYTYIYICIYKTYDAYIHIESHRYADVSSDGDLHPKKGIKIPSKNLAEIGASRLGVLLNSCFLVVNKVLSILE